MEKKNKCLEILKTLVSNMWYIVALVAIIAIIFLMIANWGVVLAVIGKFLTILMPFILGFFFACFINPLVKRVHSLLNRIKPGKGAKIKKAFSVIISYVVVIGVITVLLIYIIPQIKASIGELGNTIQDGYQYMITHQKELNEKIPFIGLGGGIEYIKEFAYKKIMSNGSEILPYVYHVSSSLLTMSYNVLMGLVISIYIILDMKKLKRSARKVVYALSPKKKEQEVWETMKQCSHIFNGFLIGKMIDSLIIGILCLIAMSILKLPYALLLSLIVCITNMIPYFGPIIGAIPGVMIYLFIDIRYAFIFALMILILQQFDGLYLGPKILGDQTGIKPLWVIFGITVGGAYFGVMGMFLGVPVVAVIMYLLQLFLDKKLKKKNISTFDSK
jgi:putative permease